MNGKIALKTNFQVSCPSRFLVAPEREMKDYKWKEQAFAIVVVGHSGSCIVAGMGGGVDNAGPAD